MKTVQFRRYVLNEGRYEAFMEWWQASFPELRTRAGFNIEFGYGIPETNEFVWAVSVDGDRERFDALLKDYEESDARAAVFAGQPDWIASAHVAFVELAADASKPAHAARS